MNVEKVLRGACALLVCSFALGTASVQAESAATVATDGFSVNQEATYQAPKPVQPAKPARWWKVPADMPLRQVLERWAGEDGWRLYWPRAADGAELITVVEVNFAAADFEHAVTKLIEGLPAEVSLSATFNRANSPMLLHVSESPRKQEIH